MRVLQVGYTDLMGKRFNGYQLNQELRKRGIEAFQIVWQQESEEDWVLPLVNSQKAKKIQEGLRLIESAFSIQSLLFPFAFKLLQHPWFKNADLVHYHLIYPNWFALWMLPILTRKKTSLWTIHDPWPITGHCVHPLDCKKWKVGCGKCPYLALPFATKKDHTAIMWNIKKHIYQNTKIDLIVGSEWMKKILKHSPLLNGHKIHMIPFGINTNLFKPENKATAKHQLGIDSDYMVIGIRAAADLLKGFKFVKRILQELVTMKKICIISFGQRGLLNEFKDRFQIIEMGWVNLDELLVKAYNAIDIFLMPSIAESFGMMAVEAMSCGLPVVGFDGTALKDTLFAPKGGIVVPQENTSELLAAVKYLARNFTKRIALGNTARKLAKKYYGFNRYVEDHIGLYNQMMIEKD